MPHIIVEHSDSIASEMLNELHNNLASQDTIDLAAIKTRSIHVKNAITGDGDKDGFVHITVKLLTGRPEELRQKIGADLKTVALAHIDADTTALSVEVHEMNPSTYVK